MGREGGGVSQKILVIANDSAVGLDYERALCPAGYDVRFYDDPAAGIQAATEGRFDLIVLSQTARDFDTLALLRQVKAAGVPARIEARVQVGPFASRQEAEQAREKLKSLGLDPGLVVAARK